MWRGREGSTWGRAKRGRLLTGWQQPAGLAWLRTTLAASAGPGFNHGTSELNHHHSTNVSSSKLKPGRCPTSIVATPEKST